MASIALDIWQTERAANLDEIQQAHRTVGGNERGRRFATQQINRAYAVLLASHFQGFCRDMHSEAVDAIVQVHKPRNQEMGKLLSISLTRGRALYRGNANESTIAEDFNRFGIEFWPSVDRIDTRNRRRREHLEAMNRWRNAIAHQDFDKVKLGGTTTLHLSSVKQWRSSCNRLATCFDTIIREHLKALTGFPPW